MSLANTITCSRIALVFPFMVLVFLQGWVYQVLAFGVFLVASLTDLWDGQVARSRGEVSNFGRLMDPIADKVLILAAFLAFMQLKVIVAWMVVLIVARELIVTGVRLWAASRGRVLSAGRGGKHKTVLQTITILTILAFLVFRSLDNRFAWVSLEWVHEVSGIVIFWLMFATVFLTLSSGVIYMKRDWESIRHAASGKGPG